MEEKSYTLIFCRRKNPAGFNEILLGMKKRGFGTGKWNGFGGKIEAEETAEEGAIRELEEESSLIVAAENMLPKGYLVFNMKESRKIMKVHVYESWVWSGHEAESDEMRPQWWREDSIPFELTWLDDRYWLPLLLKGKSFTGRLVCSLLYVNTSAAS
jgi:8-oxo-dGTP pyrophosphatase MutT (NUDIX family)